MSRLQSRTLARRFEVLVGLDYNGLRREPGDIVHDIPEQSQAWLIEQGCIRPTEEVSKYGTD